MAHPYDAKFTPPFPILPVRIRAVGESSGSDTLVAHLDTGADATLVPSAALHAIGSSEFDSARLRSH